jgi:hypothetical protein
MPLAAVAPYCSTSLPHGRHPQRFIRHNRRDLDLAYPGDGSPFWIMARAFMRRAQLAPSSRPDGDVAVSHCRQTAHSAHTPTPDVRSEPRLEPVPTVAPFGKKVRASLEWRSSTFRWDCGNRTYSITTSRIE